MTNWNFLLDRVAVTKCGKKLSTLNDAAEFASRHQKNPFWNYAGELARLAAISPDMAVVRETTIAVENAVLAANLTAPSAPNFHSTSPLANSLQHARSAKNRRAA